MLSNFPQFSPQGLPPQFAGFQGAGWPQMGPGPFGQPGVAGGNVSFGHDFGQPGSSQPYPFGGPATAFAQNPYIQHPFGQNPNAFIQNPFTQPGSLAGQPSLQNLQQVVTLLGQLAQQVAVNSALTHQIGMVLQQLSQQLAITQQLAMQSSAGLGAGGSQPFGLSPYAGSQGSYGGFNPQAQAWGANRPQTIQ